MQTFSITNPGHTPQNVKQKQPEYKLQLNFIYSKLFQEKFSYLSRW